MAIKQAKMQHVVAIPYPAQGHINPMLQLCQQLEPLGFTFTFVNTHHIHQRVQRAYRTCSAYEGNRDFGDDNQDSHDDVHHKLHAHDAAHHSEMAHAHTPDAHHADHALVLNAHEDEDNAHDAHQYKGCKPIHMVFVAGGCAPEQHAHESSWSDVFKAAQAMQEPVEQLLSHIMQEQAVAFILSDVLFGWGGTTAHKFNLPWVGFWPASAATCSAFFHFSDLAAEGKGISMAEKEGGEAPIIEGVPGLPPTHLYDLPKVWNSSTWEVKHVVLSSFEAARGASLLLLNTFEDLEGQVLEALRKRLPTLALGPLLPSHYMLHTCPDSEQHPPLSLFTEDRTCLAWLDTQAPSSVLYISFGSISLRSEQQLQELAMGVHASGCPFLWVRRPDNHSLQDGNSAFTHENGLIVPWAPQLQVLSHPSVRGFITHCGWNSVIESVSMGVPMLCWADTGERRSNQRFVVELWKCGVDMVADSTKRVTQHIDEAVLVGRDEVEKSVRLLMLEEAGAPIRARAAELRAIATAAFQDSQTRFKEFVQAMELKSLHTLT